MRTRQAGLLWLLVPLPVALGVAGCDDQFSDEQFGVLDLSSIYDGGSPSDPAAGLPRQLDPVPGFIDGERAEYYDFGFVTAIRDPKTLTPTAVRVADMYFFFTRDRLPLFSRPVREQRDLSDSMPGGLNTLNPNPVDDAAEKKKPYPGRRRKPLVDPMRGVADYQRPIVDVTPANTSSAGPPYSGLWRVVEILAPGGYVPDSIKHADTLARAVASGNFKKRVTDKVINCPMIDERTYVPTGVSARDIFRPRIELWYRRKLAFCFLANGWETLGNEQGVPYLAGQDDARIDTFDVSRLKIVVGGTQSTQIIVPVTKAYVPAVYTEDVFGDVAAITPVPENFLSRDRPRHLASDPPGYSPIRWMFDFRVYDNYEVESIKSVGEAILARTVAQRAGGRYVVKNVSTRGGLVKCSLPRVPLTINGRNVEQCGIRVTGKDGITPITDPSGDEACKRIGLECNKETCYCDAPVVQYAQACGPGVGRCIAERGDRENAAVCFPASGGFCYKQCQSRTTNTFAQENEGKKAYETLDSRCDGLPGYRCFGYFVLPNFGICLKNCDPNIIDLKTRQPDPLQCRAKGTVDGEMRELGEGQICQDLGNLQICGWPDGYTPN